LLVRAGAWGPARRGLVLGLAGILVDLRDDSVSAPVSWAV